MSVPREGIHAYRIPGVDVAAVDIVGTAAGGYVLAKYMDWSSTTTILSLFALSVPIHAMFGVRTRVTKVLESLICSNDTELVPSNSKCPFHALWSS
jgi:hypothetical protein